MWRPRTRGVLQSSVLSGVAASCGLLAGGLPPDMRQSCQCFLAGWRVDAMEGGLLSQCLGYVCAAIFGTRGRLAPGQGGVLGAGPGRPLFTEWYGLMICSQSRCASTHLVGE